MQGDWGGWGTVGMTDVTLVTRSLIIFFTFKKKSYKKRNMQKKGHILSIVDFSNKI